MLKIARMSKLFGPSGLSVLNNYLVRSKLLLDLYLTKFFRHFSKIDLFMHHWFFRFNGIPECVNTYFEWRFAIELNTLKEIR